MYDANIIRMTCINSMIRLKMLIRFKLQISRHHYDHFNNYFMYHARNTSFMLAYKQGFAIIYEINIYGVGSH